MNFVQIIATLRKLGNYLAGLFPILATIADWFSTRLQKLLRHPRIEPITDRIASNATVMSFWKIFERFYWRDYSKDRLNLDESPPESVSLLRPILQLCVVLCLLIPLTQFDVWLVPIETMSGFSNAAPAWSVILWGVALPFAWSALLVGAGLSNRFAFVIAAIACVYFMATCTFNLERSPWNGLVGLGVLFAYGMVERIRKREGNQNVALAVLAASAVGAPCGIQMVAMTPLRNALASIIPLAPPQISVIIGGLLGMISGLVALAWARAPSSEERPHFLHDEPVSNRLLLWIPAGCLFIYTSSALWRGGIGKAGGQILSSVNLSNAYLWPIWYFVGVGIVLKLMGHSRTVSKAISSGVSPRLIQPLLITLLLLSASIAFSEQAITALQSSSGTLSEVAYKYFLFFWQISKASIWSIPINAMTANWFSWVLLVDVVLVIVLLAMRTLTNTVAIRLAYLSCFAALLIWEYLFQLTSFTRSPSHSAIAVFLFAAWLLWLMHTVGWDVSTKSSQFWPSRGRFAIYSSITLFCLLEIHSRAASHDWRVCNEIFLSMFRGVVDFGLPYFIYLYATSRIPSFPIKVGTLFSAFALGAVSSLCFNALDKLAIANWSFPELKILIAQQVNGLMNTGNINLDVALPDFWLIARAVIYVALLGVIGGIFESGFAKKFRGAATAFILLAFASGVASFSSTFVDLPLPHEARVLTAPLTQVLMFNAHIIQTYLAYWLPALIMGTVLLSPSFNKPFILVFASIVGIVLNYSLFALYQDYELWLRATDVLPLALLIMIALTALIIATIVHELDVASRSFLERQRLVVIPYSALSLLLASSMIVLAWLGVSRVTNLPFKTVALPNLASIASVPSSWQLLPQDANLPSSQSQPTMLKSIERDGSASLILAGQVESDEKGTKALLKTLLQQASDTGNFPGLTPLLLESWTRRTGKSGALACYFSYETKVGKTSVPAAGLTILVPRNDGKTEYFTILTNPTDIAQNQWQLGQMVKSAHLERPAKIE